LQHGIRDFFSVSSDFTNKPEETKRTAFDDALVVAGGGGQLNRLGLDGHGKSPKKGRKKSVDAELHGRWGIEVRRT
jgi:hypothetical protein